MQLMSKLRDFLTQEPFLPAAFQVSVSGLAAACLAGRDKTSGRHVLLPLRMGALEPSFDRANVLDEKYLGEQVRESLKRLDLAEPAAAVLLPESCLKTVILSFDSLPAAAEEKAQLIIWRLKKLMPSLPEDVRISCDVVSEGQPFRVFVAAIRRSVLQEYEQLFIRQGVKVRQVGLPSLGLFNLISASDLPDGILVNIEDDCLSLLAVLEGRVAFYRLKSYLLDLKASASFSSRMDNIVREVLNTVAFLEDKEKKPVSTLWVRSGLRDGDPDPLDYLKKRIPLSILSIQPPAFSGLTAREARLLAPLLGQWS